MNLKPVIFTDLDGTLLDLETYSYDRALPSIEYLRSRDVPIIFCSVKTKAEQEVYRKELQINDPFIVENGGAIFISRGYFPFDFEYHKAKDGYLVIELGIPYHRIREVLAQIRDDTGVNFRGFGDMSAEEVASLTGLDLEAAQRAKAREYDETVTLEVTIGDSPNDLPMLSAVDIPVLVQKPGGTWEEIDVPHLHRVEGIGPEGWARAVEEIIEQGIA